MHWWSVLAVVALVVCSTESRAQELYEEDFEASQGIRKANYEQLIGYVDRLVSGEIAREPVWVPDYADVDGFDASKEPLRAALCEHMGHPAPQAIADPVARREEVAQDDVATYYRMWVEVFPGVETYGLYIVPKGVDLPAPLVISQHGGGGFPELATFHGGANYHDLVRGAVARGYVTWAPAMIFNTFGEQEAMGLPDGIRQLLEARARRAGTTLAAIEITKLSTALSAVLAQPEVDAERVAMVGLSYGGYYTLYTAALEPRIKVAVSSCFFNDRNAVLTKSEPYGWQDISYLSNGVRLDDSDIVALICPRALQVQVGQTDDLFTVDGARAAAPKAEAHYRQLGIEDQFEYFEGEGGHEFFGAPAWDFIEKWL